MPVRHTSLKLTTTRYSRSFPREYCSNFQKLEELLDELTELYPKMSTRNLKSKQRVRELAKKVRYLHEDVYKLKALC